MSSYSLLEHTEAWITRKRFKADRMLSLYPSEASVTMTDEDGFQYTEGTCTRAAFLRVTGKYPGEPPSARGEKIMSVGTTLEKWFIERWKEMGIWIDNNTKFYWAEYNVSGELDAILVEPDTGDPYGVEIKTFYGYDAEKRIFGNKSVQGFPKINQLLQTLVYTYFFRNKLKYFKMCYMSRGDARTREFKIEVQEIEGKWYPVIDGYVYKKFSIQDILDRYKMLNYYINNDIMPPRDYDLVYTDERVEREKAKGNVSKTKYEAWSKGKKKIGDWQCGYCPYKHPCWGTEAEIPEPEENEVVPE